MDFPHLRSLAAVPELKKWIVTPWMETPGIGVSARGMFLVTSHVLFCSFLFFYFVYLTKERIHHRSFFVAQICMVCAIFAPKIKPCERTSHSVSMQLTG
jgi:hypothetical protein